MIKGPTGPFFIFEKNNCILLTIQKSWRNVLSVLHDVIHIDQ